MRVTEVSSAEQDCIVAEFCEVIDLAREYITSEKSWAVLEQYFYEALLGRHTLSAAVVLAWMDAGHPAATRSVRRYVAEMIDQHREDELLAQVRGRIVKLLLRDFIPFPRGRHVVANLMRDVWIPGLMEKAADSSGLDATRSASTPTPSVAYFFAIALRKKGIKLTERQLNRLYWDRDKLGAKLEASMPAIPASTI